ncbi:DUF4276 family protein [Tautonia marina]|uniref:DUF4276 family protein n=1 Tax=Tautonia marina TaxID=2653855 RepID=UPI00137649B0|nr:DUF4276 family protein [Tautonia marina]
MSVVKLYVEGGGNRVLDQGLRDAFKRFFARSGLPEASIVIRVCGSRRDAFRDFGIALRKAGPVQAPILLVDSEEAVLPQHFGKPWDHLLRVDRFSRPGGATDDQAHLMVQCMESWFLADRQWLARYFGQHFHSGALPGASNIESIDKRRALEALGGATKACQKGKYNKGKHSSEILAGLDPKSVKEASAHAQRLFETLKAKGSGR